MNHPKTTINPSHAIAVFDSGVGGLTVLRALRQALPQENFIYLGDTARLPYGTKSTASVQRYALQAAKYLVQKEIKLLVLACNTVTADALHTLRATFPHLPIIGVISPGALAASKASLKKRIGVIATRATVRSAAYTHAIHTFMPDAEVFTSSAPLLVPLAEEGWVNGPLVTGIVQHYLEPILINNIDCLVLGCTHYPPFANLLKEILPAHITLVDSAQTTAHAVSEHLHQTNCFHRQQTLGQLTFNSTDDPQQFAHIGSLFLGEEISPQAVHLVDL